MVRMAASSGTTDLVATPHANPQYQFDPQVIAVRLAEIQAQVGDTIRLYSGCDFHLSYDNIQDAIENPAKYTIDHKNYLLVEFSDLIIFNNTTEIFERLMDAGMIPVITHPERNSLLRQRLDQLAKWVSDGARVQVTSQSLTGDFGKRAEEFSRVLLDRGLIHVIASDAHDCERRPPSMQQAYSWIEKNYSKDLAQLLWVTNPGATLTGADMQVPERDERGVGRKWYQIWK